MSKPKKPATVTRLPSATRRASAKAAERSRPPWIIDGIDYGPAIVAVGDLLGWAFDLAADRVADSPDGRRRIQNARRYVVARLAGREPRGGDPDDVLFAAGLLARIFEVDQALDMVATLGVFDRLGLPTDDVPLRPRTSRPRGGAVFPLRPRGVGATAPNRPGHRRDDADGEPAPWMFRPPFRNAA